MKRVFIIHGWEGRPEQAWFPWLKNELEIKNFEVEILPMPEPDSPRKKVWVDFLKEKIKPDEETYLVGHSIGCMAIMRYLETLSSDNAKVGGVICVAGWLTLRVFDDLDDEDKALVMDWLNPPLNFMEIKRIGNKFVAIFSDNDPFVLPENQLTYKEKLNAKIIIEHGKGHFLEDPPITELPVVLEELLKMAK